MKTLAIIFFTFLLSAPLIGIGQTTKSTLAQESNSFNLERSILLSPDSNAEEITINIKPGTQRFDLLVTGTISSGKVTVEIYDHQNNKQGDFLVETQANSAQKEMATGNFRKSRFEPEYGTWTIKIIPAKATGTIKIKSKTEK